MITDDDWSSGRPKVRERTENSSSEVYIIKYNLNQQRPVNYYNYHA